MLFSNPDYPIFLIAVFFLYALTRGHNRGFGLSVWPRAALMLLLGDLVFVLIAKDPVLLWDPLGGLVFAGLSQRAADQALALAPWWHYAVGLTVCGAAIVAGVRGGGVLASARGQRWVGVGFCIALLAVGALVLGAEHYACLPAVTAAVAGVAHLAVLAMLGVAIGASMVARSRMLARLIVLFVVSSLFYQAWAVAMHGAYRYLLALLLATIVLDFYFALAIERAASPARRKLLLVVSLVSNLGILAVFKYSDFFTQDVLHLKLAPLHLILPAGISFHTFQSMSYTIDVYRKELKATTSVTEFATFVLFFPQLVAGPIVRATELLPQLHDLPELDHRLAIDGLFRIVIGLFKKIALADTLDTVLVARVFESPSHFSSLEVAAGIVGFALQIYLDFSAYSDIAIGSANVLGFRLPENFQTPYRSANLQEFWRRWHMSLSTWLRDYLYIALGGGRGSNLLTYRNLLLTMLLGGLWHGARWTYLVWGALHGGGLAVTRFFQRRCDADRTAVPYLLMYTAAIAAVGAVAHTLAADALEPWQHLLAGWSYLTPLWAMATVGLSQTKLPRAPDPLLQPCSDGGQCVMMMRFLMVPALAATLAAMKYLPASCWLPGCVLVWGLAVASDAQASRALASSPWHASTQIFVQRTVAALLVFGYVCLAWVFFRAETCAQALAMLARLTAAEFDHANLGALVQTILAVAVLAHAFPDRTFAWWRQRWASWPALVQGCVLTIAMLVLRELAAPHFVQFIYFQF